MVSVARRAGNSAYWSRERNLGERERDELATLFGEPWSVLGDATGFISRFVDLIDNQSDAHAWASTTVEYLTTEARTIDADVEGDGTTINARHMLYWLDRVLKRNKATIGYTNRLSEAGWGEASPDNLADADPFDLVTTLEGLGHRVVVIDPDATDDNSASSQDGPVLITASSNNCTRLDGSTAKTFGGTAALFNGSSYRYRLWGMQTGTSGNGIVGGWGMIHEAGGGSVARFANTTSPVIFLTRQSNSHQIAKELIWRKPAANSAPEYILLTGYPGEFPEIRMGSSVTGAGNDTVVNGPQIFVGFSSTPRNNLHLRNLDLVGNRDGSYLTGVSEVTGRVFAKVMFYVAGSTGCSDRHCRFRDFLPIYSTHSEAGTYPEFVDIVSEARPAENGNDTSYCAVRIKGDYFTFDSNHVHAADVTIPFSEYSSDDFPLSRGTDCEANYARVTKNTYDGFSSGDYCRYTPSGDPLVGYYCADNMITSNGYKCLLAQSGPVDTEALSGTIERNFVYNSGTSGLQTFGGTLAHFFSGPGSLVVRYNTFVSNIDGQSHRSGLTAGAVTIEMADSTGDGSSSSGNGTATGGVEFYGNITWNTGVTFSSNNGGYANAQTIVASHEVYENLIHGPPEPRKEENQGGPLLDAPVLLNIYAGTTLGNTTFTNNNVTRDAGDVNETVLLAHRDGAASVTQYEVGDTQMTGVSGLTSADPQYADPANGDFTVGNATLAAYVASAPKTRAVVPAWTP